MTVAGLKKILDGFPDNMHVVVDGYEGGADDPDVVLEKVKKDLARPSYDGTYELGKGREAVLIRRIHHTEKRA